ncbi:MAG TPA: isoprenylcysteine carboxylmethyltransferase family protein [Rectinemataceae bacterium]|nr:isoprenylcysteine carboxylmethyltransferase family protein [Rectinemataceae bacterium]
MDSDTGLRIVSAALYLSVFVIRIFYAARHRRLDYRKVDRRRSIAAEGPLIYWGTSLAGAVLPLALAASFYDTGLELGFLPLGLRLGFLPLAILGILLFARSHADLGSRWSPDLELAPDHELVTGGVYARIRHPMYAGGALFYLGLALANADALVVACCLAMVILQDARIGREEEMMAGRFGDAYQAYRARTGRYFPRLGRPRPL